MAALRTLLQYSNAVGGGGTSYINYDEIVIYNTNIDTAANGGQCCLWTVPANTTWFAIEMWGGGGAGAGVCCCFGGWPGGSGSYTRKIVSGVTAGQQYRICAAGSTCCSPVCCSVQGFPSYVACNTDSTVIACASGGSASCSKCYYMINCSYSGCRQMQCGSFCGTMGICGVTGSAKGSAYCSGNSFQYMPSAPMTGGMNRPTKDGCSGYCGGCCNGGYAHFPGGGGASSFSHTTGPFCGAAGAGGMVIIYYGIVTT